MRFSKTLLFLCFFLLLLTACAQEPSQPSGDTITADENDTISYRFSSTTLLILDIDGVGPAGVSIRGVKGILQVGDPIIREVDGSLWQLGEVQEINGQQVTILLYENPFKVNK